MTDDTTSDGSGGKQAASDAVVRGDRFSGGPARGFLSSLAADEALFEADLAVDRAHVVMLAEQGIVEAETAGAILAALDDIEANGHAGLLDGEDVHEAIETAVVERVGPDGGRMHTARSRNDEVATCIRYRLREGVLDTIAATLTLRETLQAVAREHTTTVMPGYTHLQPAQPTTVAHYLLSYEGALARDTERLFDAFQRTNHSPLGAGAFAGTPFDIDRERTAELLGFDGVVRNAMDAVSSRDFLVETAGAVATLATTLSGLSEDCILFAHRGLLELDDDYSSTSSIMPQKKNPDTLELTRGVAGDAIGEVTGTLSLLKGLPRAYNRDLQRAHPDVIDITDEVAEATRVVAGAVGTAEWHSDALADATAEGFPTATDVADLLAMAGVPFRTAHEVVATAAAELDQVTADPERAVAIIDSTTRDLLGASLDTYVSHDEVRAVLDPATSVERRDSAGGPAPESVRADLTAAEERLATDQSTLEATRDVLAAAEQARTQEVASYV